MKEDTTPYHDRRHRHYQTGLFRRTCDNGDGGRDGGHDGLAEVSLLQLAHLPFPYHDYAYKRTERDQSLVFIS